jgi:hypothetical protein
MSPYRRCKRTRERTPTTIWRLQGCEIKINLKIGSAVTGTAKRKKRRKDAKVSVATKNV